MAAGLELAQLAADAASAATPRAALRKLSELRQELEAFERRQVAHALAEGASFAAVARDLGLSRQAVHRRFRALQIADAPLPTAPDVRRVLRLAREEAVALGAEELRGEHVLLAVLRAPELPSARALIEAGATLERVREQLRAAPPRARRFERNGGDGGDLRALLAGPARAARADGRRMEVEDLLLATLGDARGLTVKTLRALDVDADAARRALTVSVTSQ